MKSAAAAAVLVFLPLVSRVAAADSSATAEIQLNQAGQDLAADLGLDVAGFEETLREKVKSALGVSAVPVGLLDHRLLVRLIEQARPHQVAVTANRQAD